MGDGISRFIEQLRVSKRILIFCGAGVSTASGIPDFRGPGGVWTRRRPVEYLCLLGTRSACL
jgi:NAD-dependent protein deacetylase/lipoamidase